MLLPGHGGGANYGGTSFDPETGMMYVPSVTSPMVAKIVPGDPKRGNAAFRHSTTIGLPTLDGLLLVKPPYARITAYDLGKGEIVWQVPLGDGPRNHPLIKDLDLGPLGSDGKGHPLLRLRCPPDGRIERGLTILSGAATWAGRPPPFGTGSGAFPMAAILHSVPSRWDRPYPDTHASSLPLPGWSPAARSRS